MLCFCLSAPLCAQEEALELKVQSFRKARIVQWLVTAAASQSECSVSLFVADKKSVLDQDTTAGTVFGTLDHIVGVQTILATKLPLLRSRRGKKGARFFAQARSSCGDRSRIARFIVPYATNRGVKGGIQWLERAQSAVITDTLNLERAFSSLTFERPVDLQSPGKHSDRLYVVEQSGRILSFVNDSTVTEATVLLDIRDRVAYNEGEQGLLGLAFDPQVKKNGEFYVYYTATETGATVVARYRFLAGSETEADSVEERVLEVAQPAKNHNGGQIAFGPDGYLYIALGDGGGANDVYKNGQDRTTLLGSLLRIDVSNAGESYRIPKKNPFVGNKKGFREEIYAYGFRNPWRFSFDSKKRQLWLADVGQGSWEEVNIVKAGKNYGWNTMEGNHCFPDTVDCNQKGLVLPVAEYSHRFGSSITGGYVYRGKATPQLRGFYTYADFISGNIWIARRFGKRAVSTRIHSDASYIASFGTDADNELYLLSFGGGLYRLQ